MTFARRTRLGSALLVLGLLGRGGGAAVAPREPSGTPLFEGRYVFASFGRDDGLADLNVESLLQDRTGFLWVGTDNGLYRYDGRQFVRMGTELAALDTRVNALHETPQGILCAGTSGGLACREGETFVAVGEESGLPATEILDGLLASDERGRLWVGTTRGLFVGEKGRFRLVPRGDGAPEGRITALHRDRGGALWVARRASLTVTAGDGAAEVAVEIPLPPGEQIDRIVTDGAGRLWIRTLRTLWFRAPGEDRFVRDDEGLPASSEFGRLALGEGGEVLVPSTRGFARKEEGAWRVTGRRDGLPGGTVNTALVDREGSLWVGLSGEGLARRLGRGAFRGGGEAEGLSHNLVWAIVREPSRQGTGALWVGTEEGLNRIDAQSGRIEVFLRKDGLASDAIQALAVFPDGRLYAAHWPGGVTRIGPGKGVFRVCDFEGADSSGLRVVSLYRTRQGDLLAGTDQGVFRLRAKGAPDRFVKFPVPETPSGWRKYAFVEDGAGLLWGAGEGGLFRLSGPDPRRFGPEDGLRSRDLSGIVLLDDGSFAVGHRNMSGVDRVLVRGDRLTVTPFPLAPGEPSGKVVFLGRDAAGAVWAGTQLGIDVFPATGPPVHYGRSDGLISDDMNQNAFFAEVDGVVWIGTSRGLVRFTPGVAAAPRHPPRVVFLEAWAGARRLGIAAPASLGRGERDLRLSWTALTFIEPRRIRYRYRLIGLEAPPVETGLAEVRFPALPSGDYRFEVRAISSSDVESERPAVFTFSVARAWWEQGWTWLFGGLLFAFIVGRIIQWRTRSLETERERLEAAVAERSAELAAMNRELQEASLTDPLTGLRNRRFFSAEIGREIAKVVRAFRPAGGGPPPEGRDVVFYLVDLDHFKEINDLHGHDAGDGVLVEVAARLGTVVRKSDWLVRWGGEEFLIVSREGDRQQARLLAERLLAVISREPFDLGRGRSIWRTCSIGWAPFPFVREAPDAVHHDEVLRLADRALLLAKRSGRHQSVGFLPRGTMTGDEAKAILRQPLLDGDEQPLDLVRSLGSITPE